MIYYTTKSPNSPRREMITCRAAGASADFLTPDKVVSLSRAEFFYDIRPHKE
jgi:hypothetical protein